jgi:protein-S-isoprenylcysteine O-methyltransferase Ste14
LTWEAALSFQATDFEFRHRVWVIAGLFFLAFNLYRWDHKNVSAAIVRLAAGRGASLDSGLVDRWTWVLIGAGACVVALAALIRSWATAYLRSSVVYDASLHSDRLVADGPYRHLRNPLYLGTILLAVGMGLMASRAGFVLLAGGMVLFTYRLIRREEATLLSSQGETYRQYFHAVPGLVPSLRARLPAGDGKPNWLDGFSGELFMWGCAAGMAVFVATEKQWLMWAIIASGFAVHFGQNFLRKRPAGSRQA